MVKRVLIWLPIACRVMLLLQHPGDLRVDVVADLSNSSGLGAGEFICYNPRAVD